MQYFKTEQQKLLEQEKQLLALQAARNKGGYFDNIGLPDPRTLSAGAQPSTSGGINPQAMEALKMHNLTNPNQIQGAANNAGLLLGSTLSRLFSKQKPEAASPELLSENIRAMAARKFADYVKELGGGDDANVEALRRTSMEMIKAGADLKDDPRGLVLISEGQSMWKEYADVSDRINKMRDFTPVNVTMPDGKDELVTSKEQLAALSKQGGVLAGSKSINLSDRIQEVKVGGNFRYINGLKPDGTPNFVPELGGSRVQQTQDVPYKGVGATEMVNWQNYLNSTNQFIDMADDILDIVAKNPAAASKWGRLVSEFVSGVGGTISAAADVTGAEALDPTTYTEFFEKNKEKIAASGLTSNALIRLAYLAASVREGSGTSQARVGPQQIKQELESLGGNLSTPETFKENLTRIKKESIRGARSKFDNDRIFGSDPDSSDYKWLNDRIGRLESKVKSKESVKIDDAAVEKAIAEAMKAVGAK